MYEQRGTSDIKFNGIRYFKLQEYNNARGLNVEKGIFSNVSNW